MTKTTQGLSPSLILLMSIATGLAVASNYYAQPLLDTIARNFSLSASTAGFIVTAAQLGYAAGLLFLVPLGDMFERRMLIVSMTLDFATCMLTESTLSYLGFGIPFLQYRILFGYTFGKLFLQHFQLLFPFRNLGSLPLSPRRVLFQITSATIGLAQ